MKFKPSIALLMTPLLLTGCNVFEDIFYITVKGEGEVVTSEYENKDYEKFTTLNVSDLRMPNNRASVKVYESADEHKIVVKAQENIEEKIKVKFLGTTIYVEAGEYEKYSTDAIEIEVYGFTFSTVKLSTIRGWIYENTLNTSNALIDCSAASYVEAYNVQSEKVEVKASGASYSYVPINKENISELKCSVSGASDVTINASTNTIANTYLNVSGASLVRLTGNTNYLEASVSGASEVNAPKFLANEVKVNLSGASNVAINVANKLRAQLSGASTLTYYSSNENLDFSSPNVSGGSRIIKGKLDDIA